MGERIRAELAPTGKLRAGMNLGNALFTQKDPATGAVRGVSVDVMNELGRRLGVPVEFVMYATPGEVADAVDQGTWDVAILAIEQTRAERIAFSPGMTGIEVGYLVPEGSRIRNASDVDQPGVRIAVAEKAGYEGPLMRGVKHAQLVRAKGQAATFDAFRTQGLEAYIGLKPALEEFAAKMPGSRIVEGRFMTVQHGIGTPRARTAAAEYLRNFVDDLIASGFIARSIEKSGVHGLLPARL
jgi:polar amino acid transport system substrate-binding protein